MVERLTVNDFRPLVGTTFRIADPPLEITLDSVAEVMESERAKLNRCPFSLYFSGPSSTFLPQKTYQLAHEAFSQALEIFIVPIGRTAERFEYEAVFT